MAVYNVFIVCAIGVPVALFGHRSHQYEFCFYVITSCIVFCTTLTLCLVFVPKVCFKLECQLHVLESQLFVLKKMQLNFIFFQSFKQRKQKHKKISISSALQECYKCSFWCLPWIPVSDALVIHVKFSQSRKHSELILEAVNLLSFYFI